MISLYDRVENTVGKGENAGYQHFLLFLPAFSPFPTVVYKAFFFRVVKSRDCVVKSQSKTCVMFLLPFFVTTWDKISNLLINKNLNNSVHELFIFKILLIAIDWNF